MRSNPRHGRGSIGIQIMIAMALVFLLSTLLLPSKEDTIRSRVSQGLAKANEAKQALSLACQQSNRVVFSNADAGFHFVESMYVADIRMNADCAKGVMDIRVRMQNTGAETEPELLLSSEADDATGGSGLPVWHCGLTRGDVSHVPADCREAVNLG